MKKTYIIPEMMAVPFIASQVIAQSPVKSVSGAEGLGKGQGYFTGGDAEVKESSSSSNVWDNEW